MQGIVVHARKTPIGLRQARSIVIMPGHLQCLLKEHQRVLRAEEVLSRKHSLSIERNAFHLCILYPTSRLKHSLVGGLRSLGVIADFVSLTELAEQMMQACHRDIHLALTCQLASLLVMSDRITRGKHSHRLVACRHTPTKREVRRSARHCVVSQFGGGGTCLLQNLEGSPMENAPAGISSLDIRYLANLVVGKHVSRGLHASTLTLRFLQEQALDGFIQGEEPILSGQLSNLTEGLEGEVMVQDRARCQELASSGRELGKATLDHLTHTGWQYGTRHLGAQDDILQLEHPAFPLNQARHQHSTLKQRLKRRPHKERLSLRFGEEPRTKAFNAWLTAFARY